MRLLRPFVPPRTRLVGGLLALLLLVPAGLLVVAAQDEQPAARDPAVARARALPALVEDPVSIRVAAVRRLLVQRSEAVERGDRAAFLAGVDPQASAFRQRQAALFDALAEVPVAGWHYVLDPSRERPRDDALDARYGTWWAPEVVLRYRLAGYDDVPTAERQALTFVQRDGAWYLAADDDFEGVGASTTRGLWDAGDVVAVRRPAVLVLGHPGDQELLEDVAEIVEAAVPRVTRVWGPWSGRVVVLVPADAAEVAAVTRSTGDLTQIAALATAEVAEGDRVPVGDRVVVNPSAFAQLGPLGRRVVLTHEVLHVASRAATGPAAPAWLVEGLADHVGHLGVGLPVHVAARELRADVLAGRVPRTLPDERAFDGDNPDLAQAYEQAWLAVELLVERYGRERVLAFYRAVGRADGQAEVEQVWADAFGTTPAAFTESWRRSLRARLR